MNAKKSLVIFCSACALGVFAAQDVTLTTGPISADSDVRTNGRLVYALSFNKAHTWDSGDTVEVNGVPFRFCDSTTCGCVGSLISLVNGLNSWQPTGSVSAHWTGASDAYKDVLNRCLGVGGKTRRSFSILGLKPNRRYLFQLWCGQDSVGGTYQEHAETVTFDPGGANVSQVVTINSETGPFGSQMVFEFTPTDESVTIYLQVVGDNANHRVFMNALQLRELAETLDPIDVPGDASVSLTSAAVAFDAPVHVGGTLSVASASKTTDAERRELWMLGPATIGSLSLADAEVDLYGPVTVGGISLDQPVLSADDDYATDGAVPTLLATKPLSGLTDLSGCGRFFAEGMQTVTVANASLFMGTLGGGMSLVKRGAGTLTLFGTNAFAGSLRIEQGTLALGTIASLRERLNVLYDLDASAPGSVTTDANGVVTMWKDCSGGEAYYKTCVGEPFLTNGFFNGRQAVNFGVSTSEMRFLQFWQRNAEGAQQPAALFAVCHQHERTAKYYQGRLWAPNYPSTADSNNGLSIYSSSGKVAVNLGVDNSMGVFYNETTSNVGGAADEYLDMVVSAVGVDVRTALDSSGTKFQVIGGGRSSTASNAAYCFAGAIGEFLALGDQPSEFERETIVRYLLRKWNVKDVEGNLLVPAYETIPHTADVVMAPDTTLDLGGDDLGVVEVGSFTGAGTVTNGHLRTANGEFVQRGGALTIPAVSDGIYAASAASEPLVITGGASAENVTIRLPDGYVGDRDAGKKAIFFEGTPKFVDASGRELTSLPVHRAADGWWRVNSGIVLIVR